MMLFNADSNTCRVLSRWVDMFISETTIVNEHHLTLPTFADLSHCCIQLMSPIF